MSKHDRGSGTSVVRVGPVALACMRTEARELLDRAVEAWKRDHPNLDPCDSHHTPYRTLYWLFRYSGVIQYEDSPSCPS